MIFEIPLQNFSQKSKNLFTSLSMNQFVSPREIVNSTSIPSLIKFFDRNLDNQNYALLVTRFTKLYSPLHHELIETSLNRILEDFFPRIDECGRHEMTLFFWGFAKLPLRGRDYLKRKNEVIKKFVEKIEKMELKEFSIPELTSVTYGLCKSESIDVKKTLFL